ncbi:MAG: hypothetical protein QM523_02430 [Candidatus Pacebacteria bacterium]|nr:hypothetical protein [Candidatus Paceibacterota bacterium]
MKKIVLCGCLMALLLLTSTGNAYQIGGMYATLEKCVWESYGYQHGYVGYYRGSDGKSYTFFFGGNYCQH